MVAPPAWLETPPASGASLKSFVLKKGYRPEKLHDTRMGMTPSQLKARIETLAPGTYVEVTDLTGTQDHYQALIVSSAFEGKMMIEQHKMVFDLFKAEMGTEEVHAFSLKTFTPAQSEKFKQR